VPIPRGRPGALLVAVTMSIAAVVVTAVALRSGGSSAVARPNSVAVIDPQTNKVVATIPTGAGPEAVDVGGGFAWIANVDEKTLSQIDVRTRTLKQNIRLPATPTGLAYGFGAVWVAHGLLGTLSRVDPQYGASQTIRGLARFFVGGGGSVAVGAGSVWAAYGDSSVTRINPASGRVVNKLFAGNSPSAVTFGYGSLWVANAGDSSVTRIDPRTNGIDGRPISVGRRPSDVVVVGGAVSVATTAADSVSRAYPPSNSSTSFPVGHGPVGIAYCARAVWVANSEDGTVSRIDPATKAVGATIRIGNSPRRIACGAGLLWVTVQELKRAT